MFYDVLFCHCFLIADVEETVKTHLFTVAETTIPNNAESPGNF